MLCLRAIIIAVVVAVVLGQRPQFTVQNTGGRGFHRNGPIQIPGAIRTDVQQQAPRRRAQTPQRRPSPVFTNADFDYLDNLDFILKPKSPSASPIFPPFRSAPRPSQPSPKPAPKAPRPPPPPRATPAPAPAPAPVRQQNRRVQPAFRQRFDIAGLEEQPLDQAPEKPPVIIEQSWSNTNSDGSFNYGYINSDGSFKNETKGADCVVRGIYGYVDEATGETISHPYVTGNPCDPNEPDYFYDYDTGVITADNSFRGRLSQAPIQRQ